jgi:hypothetical protein
MAPKNIKTNKDEKTTDKFPQKFPDKFPEKFPDKFPQKFPEKIYEKNTTIKPHIFKIKKKKSVS